MSRIYTHGTWIVKPGHEEEFERRDPVVHSSRGQLTYAELLQSQLSHADFHWRQLAEFLSAQPS